MLVVIGLVAWLLSRSFNKVYTSAQAALIETFEDNAEPLHPAPEAPDPLLAAANLTTAVVPAGSPAAGRMIRELALRTQTGASIVALERGGDRQVNPGPDEEVQAGDRVLLLGSPQQLEAAKALLASV